MTVALISGSSRGIGRAIALKLADRGFDVVVNYRTSGKVAAEVVEQVEAKGSQAVAVQADVSDPEQLTKLFQEAEDRFGGLDVFVGNAATATYASIAETTDQDFDLMWRTNARATLLGLRESARRMRSGGAIVIISSAAVIALPPYSGAYAATKMAGDMLVRMAAKELGPRRITVNSVLPGPTRTELLVVDPDVIAQQTPLGRVGEPQDIAGVVDFLVSPSGVWVTGQSIVASGGLV